MNNKHLSWYKEINNNFIIVSRAYFLQSPTCTRVNNLDYTVMILTPMEFWCWSCFARGRGLVNGSASDSYVSCKSLCLPPGLGPGWNWSVSWCAWFSCEIWIPLPRQLHQYCHKRFSLDPMHYVWHLDRIWTPSSRLLHLLLPKQLCIPLHT